MARTDSKWQTGGNGSYIQTIAPDGYDILINGTNKYLNFNTIVGSSGYGFRDNAGTIEFKNSGGSWNAFFNPIITSPSAGQVITFNGTNWVNDNVPGGSGGGSQWFYDQTPTDGGTYPLLQGTIDGVNQLFTVSEGQYISGKLVVAVNGVICSQGTGPNEWTETDPVTGTFTLNTAPSNAGPSPDEVSAFYTTTAGGGGGDAAGADTEVQFNDAGALNGDPTFLFNKTTNKLTVEAILLSGLTASELVATDASKNLVSLAVATYPSLAEVAHVKGVTSALQTQLDGKLSDSGDTGTGTYNFAGATVFRLPSNSNPTLSSVGAIAHDDTVTDWADGLWKSYNGVLNTIYAFVQIPVSGLGSPSNGNVVAYNSSTDAFELAVPASGTVTSVSGTTNRITSTGGATPVIDIAATYVGQSSITTVGTLSAGDATAVVSAASTSAAGKVELAIASEIDTGTDSTRAMGVAEYVASKRNVRHVTYRVLSPTTNTVAASSTALGGDFECPIAGTIIAVYAYNDTAGTTGTATYDIHLNGTTIMTTTKISIETTEKSSRAATTQPTLTTTAIAVGDILTFYCDAIHTTPGKGLSFEIDIRE